MVGQLIIILNNLVVVCYRLNSRSRDILSFGRPTALYVNMYVCIYVWDTCMYIQAYVCFHINIRAKALAQGLQVGKPQSIQNTPTLPSPPPHNIHANTHPTVAPSLPLSLHSPIYPRINPSIHTYHFTNPPGSRAFLFQRCGFLHGP